jgi:hypothetical protein
MAWTESHTVLIRHRKTVSTALQLNIKPVQVVGHLTVFWHSVLEQAEDGDISKWSAGFISSAACWEGPPDDFKQALIDNGWIENGLVHDWLDYAGRYLASKYRISKPELMSKIREKHGKSKAIDNLKTDNRQSKDSPDNLDNLNKITEPKLPNRITFDFEPVWAAYPNKDGRKAAEKHFRVSVLTQQDYDNIKKAIVNYRQSDTVKNGFIKSGSTFFNNWRDWIDFKGVTKTTQTGNMAAPVHGKYDGIGEKV